MRFPKTGPTSKRTGEFVKTSQTAGARVIVRAILCGCSVLCVVFLTRETVTGTARLMAQERVANGGAQEKPDVVPPRPKMNWTPISSRIQSTFIDCEELAVRTKEGSPAITSHGRGGTPYLIFFDKNEVQRLWVALEPDGDPGIIFFDKDGGRPVKLTVSREGEPRVVLKSITLPPPKVLERVP